MYLVENLIQFAAIIAERALACQSRRDCLSIERPRLRARGLRRSHLVPAQQSEASKLDRASYFAGVITNLRNSIGPWSPWSNNGPGAPSSLSSAPPVMPGID